MTFAELLLKIGISGDQSVNKALTGVDKQLDKVSEGSLAAKAGILAVVYGLERLTGFASQAGMDLSKFALATGLSTDELQKWQYVGRRYDVSAEEIGGTIRNLQKITTDMMLGKGIPEGAAALGIKMTRDPFNMLMQLQKAAKSLPPDVAGRLLSSFGISDNVFQMLRASNIEMEKIPRWARYTDQERDALAGVNKQWKDLWLRLEMFGGREVMKHGGWAVRELSEAFKIIVEAGTQVSKMTDKFGELKVLIIAIGVAIGIAFAPVTTIVSSLIYLLAEIQKYREGKDGIIKDAVGVVTSAEERLNKTEPGLGGIGDRLANHKMDLLKAAFGDVFGAFGKIGTGIGDLATQGLDYIHGNNQVAQAGSVQINNTFHIDGSHSPKDTAHAVKKEISDAARQIGAQAGGQ